MQPPLITGPIPPYNNPPIEPRNFTPRNYVISDIVLGQNTLVTIVRPHDYVIGQEIRLVIPEGYGCYQINQKTGYVILIPSSTSVIVDILSVDVDPFTSSYNTTQPQIVAIGDVNSGQVNFGRTNNKTYIPGSFRNISPQGPGLY